VKLSRSIFNFGVFSLIGFSTFALTALIGAAFAVTGLAALAVVFFVAGFLVTAGLPWLGLLLLPLV